MGLDGKWWRLSSNLKKELHREAALPRQGRQPAACSRRVQIVVWSTELRRRDGDCVVHKSEHSCCLSLGGRSLPALLGDLVVVTVTSSPLDRPQEMSLLI